MAKERLGSPIFNCTSAVLYSLLESHFRRGFGYLKAVSKCPNIEPCKRPFKFPLKFLERGLERNIEPSKSAFRIGGVFRENRFTDSLPIPLESVVSVVSVSVSSHPYFKYRMPVSLLYTCVEADRLGRSTDNVK